MFSLLLIHAMAQIILSLDILPVDSTNSLTPYFFAQDENDIFQFTPNSISDRTFSRSKNRKENIYTVQL
jgi:hypothetical protein